jgi:hypothetical protein
MLNRVIQFGLATILTTAIAGYGTAHAQEEETAPVEGETAEGTTEATGEGEMAAEGEATAETTEGEGEMAAEGEAEGGGDHHGLRKGGIAIAAAIEINMSKELVAKPFSIAPDIWYGVTDKIGVGLIHSSYGRTGFWDGVGSSLCLAGEEKGCPKLYNSTSLYGRFGLSSNAQMSLAAVGGIDFRLLDPEVLMALRVGIDGMYNAGKIMIAFSPNISAGLNKRDDFGNKELLNVPVAFLFAATPQLHVGLQTGIRGPLDGFGDAYTVPVSLGAMFAVNPNIMVGGSFGLNRVAGYELPDGVGVADMRSLTLFAGWRN